MNVRLCLAMNDDNGYSIGKVRQIEAYVNNEHAYTLEPTCDVRDVCTCEIFTGSNQLHLGKFIFPLVSYQTQVGNLFWNEVVVKDDVHAKIFEVLKDMQYKPTKHINTNPYSKWRMTEGLDAWIKRWNTGLIGVWIDQDTYKEIDMKIKATQHETNLGQMRGIKMPTDSESIKILRRRKGKKRTK